MYALYQTLSDIWTEKAEAMQPILTELTTTISEFKKNPNLEVARANGKPFAVLTNNRPTFYVVSPEVFDELLERVWESDIASEISRRRADGLKPVEVELETNE